MDNNSIENILRSNEMYEKIHNIRKQYSHIMSEFYFFKIFIESLKEFGIDTKIDKTSKVINGVPKNECSITLCINNDSICVKYDEDELRNDISQFNQIQNDLGMRGSVNYLIDLFINLIS